MGDWALGGADSQRLRLDGKLITLLHSPHAVLLAPLCLVRTLFHFAVT
jgi:hypothetical protein